MTTKYLRLFFNHAASQKSEITNIGMSKYENNGTIKIAKRKKIYRKILLY